MKLCFHSMGVVEFIILQRLMSRYVPSATGHTLCPDFNAAARKQRFPGYGLRSSFRRNWPGVSPVARRKAKQKLELDENPNAYAIDVTLSSAARSRLACPIWLLATYSPIEHRRLSR